MHGSVSWATDGESVVDFADSKIPEDGHWQRRLIYPTPRKITESFGEPYSTLLSYFSTVIDRPNALLVTLGFSYRDQHVVERIRQFISNPTHTLVALVRETEQPLEVLLEHPNVICVTNEKAWLDGKQRDETLGIWELPSLVKMLEEL